MSITAFAALFLSAAGCVLAQPAASPLRFESVIIKRGKPPKLDLPKVFLSDLVREPQGPDGCTGGPGAPDPGPLKCHVSLATFVKLSYNLGPLQLTPLEWMDSSWWDIEAKIPSGASPQQVQVMEQNLLAERFKFEAHFVKKEVAAYEMTVSRDGVNFRPWDPDVAAAGSRWPRIVKAANLQVLEDHTYRDVEECNDEHHVRGELSMQEFTRYLTEPGLRLDRPVLDQTGLTGFYDITLDYLARKRTVGDAGAPPPTVGHSQTARCVSEGIPVSSPSLIEAVHKQLGLVLELTKNTADVLVIDHVEKKPMKN